MNLSQDHGRAAKSRLATRSISASRRAKAQEIADAIGMGGTFVFYDGGAMWITRGSPWCQNIADESDKDIKRRYLNLTVEYLSQN